MKKERIKDASAIVKHEAHDASHEECVCSMHEISVIYTKENRRAKNRAHERDYFVKTGKYNSPEKNFFRKRSENHINNQPEIQRDAVQSLVILRNVFGTEDFPADFGI